VEGTYSTLRTSWGTPFPPAVETYTHLHTCVVTYIHTYIHTYIGGGDLLDVMDLLGDAIPTGGRNGVSAVSSSNINANNGKGPGIMDLMDLMGDMSVSSSHQEPQNNSMGMGTGAIDMQKGFGKPLLGPEKGKGMSIEGTLAREGGRLVYKLAFTNKGQVPLTGFAIQFNKNTMGVTNAGPLQLDNPTIMPGNTSTATVPLHCVPDKVQPVRRCVYMCVCVCMYVCMYVCVYVCMYVRPLYRGIRRQLLCRCIVCLTRSSRCVACMYVCMYAQYMCADAFCA
jgi:hypothetical protein